MARLDANAAGLVRFREPGIQGVDWPAPGRASVVVPRVRLDADDDAYQQAALWSPGRSPAVRQWTLAAVGVIVLTVGVAAYADPKRATRWTIIAAAGLCVGIVVFFPEDSQRRTLPADGRSGWEWVWVDAAAGTRIEESWSPGLRFVPRSAGQSKQADPVLRCDAAGRPAAVSATVPRGDRAVFIRRRVSATPRSE